VKVFPRYLVLNIRVSSGICILSPYAYIQEFQKGKTFWAKISFVSKLESNNLSILISSPPPPSSSSSSSLFPFPSFLLF
jgi:hypothetical protein